MNMTKRFLADQMADILAIVMASCILILLCVLVGLSIYVLRVVNNDLLVSRNDFLRRLDQELDNCRRLILQATSSSYTPISFLLLFLLVACGGGESSDESVTGLDRTAATQIVI